MYYVYMCSVYTADDVHMFILYVDIFLFEIANIEIQRCIVGAPIRSAIHKHTHK